MEKKKRQQGTKPPPPDPIPDWISSELGIELKKRNPHLFDQLTKSLKDSYRLEFFPNPPPSLQSAKISVADIEALEKELERVKLSLLAIDARFLDEIIKSWKLFYAACSLAKEHQQARKTAFNREIRRYDRQAKHLQTAPIYTPELKAELREQTLWPTKAHATLGGFDEVGPIEVIDTTRPIEGQVMRYVASEKHTFERLIENQLRALKATDPRYRRLPKTFRHWPVWKDATRSLMVSFAPKFSQYGPQTYLSTGTPGQKYPQAAIEAITKLLHLCFPLWYPDNRTVTQWILYGQ